MRIINKAERRNIVIFSLLFLLILVVSLFLLYKKQEVTSNNLNKEYTCKDCNIILITFDSLRADRFGVFGSDKNLTPNMDEFAKKSIIFPNAISNTGFTLTSITSLFTSKYPYVDFEINGFSSQKDYLFIEELNKNEYTTISFVMSNMLYNGYIKGFDKEYDMRSGIKNNIPKIISILEETRKDNKPFFLWIHVFEPHYPYVPNKEFFYEQYPEGINGPDLGEIDLIEYAINKKGFKGSTSQFDDMEVIEAFQMIGLEAEEGCDFFDYAAKYLNLTGEKKRYSLIPCIFELNDIYLRQINVSYNAYIKQTDYYISELLDYYEKNLYTNTLFIISSDHAEVIGQPNIIGETIGLSQPNIIGHDYIFYNMIHIPLIIRLPGVESGIIQNTVSIVDLTPTILEIIGHETKNEMRGISVFRRKKEDIHFAFQRIGKQVHATAIKEGYAYLNNEIYDISKDPDELYNITKDYDFNERMMLEKEIMIILNDKNINKSEDMTEELKKKLKSLGYIS